MANRSDKNFKTTLEALIEGEEVPCTKCGTGKFVTDSKTWADALSFYCDKCGCRINADPVIDIMNL